MIYLFLTFRLDPHARTVMKNGVPVPMTAKVFDMLLLLVQHRGKVVTKEQFFKAIWPGAAIEESNLSQNVFLLRKLLGEKDAGQKIIFTHTGAGYSFLPEVQEVPGGPAPSPPPARHGWLIPLLALCILLVIASLAIIRAGRSQPATRKWAASTRPGVESYPALSPDGSSLAFTWDGGTPGAPANLYVLDLPAENKPLTAARLLTPKYADDAACPVWSPDGRTLAFVRQGPRRAAIYTIASDGSAERKVRDALPITLAFTGCVAAFSPDGRSLAVTTAGAGMQTHLIRVSLESGAEEALTPAPEGVHSGSANPVYSPDGRSLAFLGRDTRASMDIFVAPASPDGTTTGEPRQLTHEKLPMQGLAWASDSKSIVYSATRQGVVSLWRIPVEGGVSETVAGGDQGQYPTISRHGRLSFAVLSENRNLWKLTLPARGVPRTPPSLLLSSTRRDEGPVFSRDGRSLSFFSDRTGSYEIWTCQADGSQPRALTSFGGAFAGLTDWSLDGRTILFDTVTPKGSQDIYSVPSAGGKAEPLIVGPALDAVPAFSRDDRWIYFSSTRGGGRFQIWRADGDGKNPVQITKEGGLGAHEAEDGYLYYSSGCRSPEWDF